MSVFIHNVMMSNILLLLTLLVIPRFMQVTGITNIKIVKDSKLSTIVFLLKVNFISPESLV